MADVQLQSAPGNVIMLRTAKLRHRDTCRLMMPHTTLHPFPENDDTWPAAVRECIYQCGDEHLHYCRRKQGPTNHPGWRDALVNLFHTTGTPHPRLTFIHPTRAGHDANTGPQETSDGLHLQVADYRCQGKMSPPCAGGDIPPAGGPDVHPPLRAGGQ